MTKKLSAALCTAIGSTLFTSAALSETIVDHVRAATERFVDVTVATAEGYGPIPCASGSVGGAMGIHYVNGRYLNEDGNALDMRKPEAIMYEPQADGSLMLVGVEYITFEGPASLEGHLFNFVASPNRYGLEPFYELHVWAHRENPAGPFADMNKDVSCELAEVAPPAPEVVLRGGV